MEKVQEAGLSKRKEKGEERENVERMERIKKV